jgi:hypothetical protein
MGQYVKTGKEKGGSDVFQHPMHKQSWIQEDVPPSLPAPGHPIKVDKIANLTGT